MTLEAGTFDPSDSGQRGYTAYGPAEFPDARDAVLDEYVAQLRAGGPPAVQEACARVSQRGRDVLAAYAVRAASRAVRDSDPECLIRGLVAVVVGGLDENGREALLHMPALEDACRRLGLEPGDVFGDAAAAVGHPGTVNLALWLARAPEARTLECMGYGVREDESGFRYVWVGWPGD